MQPNKSIFLLLMTIIFLQKFFITFNQILETILDQYLLLLWKRGKFLRQLKKASLSFKFNFENNWNLSGLHILKGKINGAI